MKKYLIEHINFIEDFLKKENSSSDLESVSKFNLTQIGFFQHERLIHLLVTLFFALLFICFVIVELFLTNASNGFLCLGLLMVGIILLITLVFYVWHYFVLENGVQKLYRLQNEIMKRYQSKGLSQ
jgi:hypothetical protein